MCDEAKIPAVKSNESPGKKNPKNNPDSAKIIRIIPISPKVNIILCGSNKSVNNIYL